MRKKITHQVLLAAIAGCYALLSAAQPDADESCGLGVAPDAKGFAEHQARMAAEVKRNGFQRVCEANLKRFDVFGQLQRGSVSPAFQPVNLSGTPFAQFQDMGAMVETVGGIKSRLYRGFRTPEGYLLTLFEHDMSADGSNSYRAPENEPERINGMPARLVILEAKSGKAISVLSWKEGRRNYELWMDVNAARKKLQAQLIALAGSLPKSVPANPNEAPPKPFKLGPDGLPQITPPPTLPAEKP